MRLLLADASLRRRAHSFARTAAELFTAGCVRRRRCTRIRSYGLNAQSSSPTSPPTTALFMCPNPDRGRRETPARPTLRQPPATLIEDCLPPVREPTRAP